MLGGRNIVKRFLLGGEKGKYCHRGKIGTERGGTREERGNNMAWNTLERPSLKRSRVSFLRSSSILSRAVSITPGLGLLI